MIDLNLLRLMKYRRNFSKIMGRIPESAIESTTLRLLKDFGRYFEKLPDHDRIAMGTFATMFSSWHPDLSHENKVAYANILKKVRTDAAPQEEDAVMQSLLDLRLGEEVTGLLRQYDSGEDLELHTALETALIDYRRDARVRGLDHVEVDIGELLSREEDDHGLRFRLDCLNRSMRGLRDGDFGIIAGRPDKGKTTFVASEITHMAAQDERSIVWLNNEGPGDRIYTRLYQAALGMTMPEMIALHNKGKLIPAYEEAIKGDRYKIRVFDIHGRDTHAVSSIIDRTRPSIVVFDMIDNIRGFGSEARTDLALERMYQWGREAAVRQEFAGLATSQISAEGANLMFPPDSALKDSKTGKQGACDFIMMLGAVDDPGYASSRFIGVPKNKLRRQGSPGDPKATVNYKPEIARYEDPIVEEDD